MGARCSQSHGRVSRGQAALTEIFFYIKCAQQNSIPKKAQAAGWPEESQGGKSPKVTRPPETSVLLIQQHSARAPWLTDPALAGEASVCSRLRKLVPQPRSTESCLAIWGCGETL